MIELRNKEIVFKNPDGTFDAKIVLQYRVNKDRWLEYIVRKEMEKCANQDYSLSGVLEIKPPNDRNDYSDYWTEWTDVPLVAWDQK